MSDHNETREQGVEVGAVSDELEAEQFPIEKSEVVEKYGDHRIGLEEDGEKVREILAPLGETTFESESELLQTIIGNVSKDSVGRERYSDRGDALNDQERENESI